MFLRNSCKHTTAKTVSYKQLSHLHSIPVSKYNTTGEIYKRYEFPTHCKSFPWKGVASVFNILKCICTRRLEYSWLEVLCMYPCMGDFPLVESLSSYQYMFVYELIYKNCEMACVYMGTSDVCVFVCGKSRVVYGNEL